MWVSGCDRFFGPGDECGAACVPQEDWEAEFLKYRASPEFMKVNLSMGLQVGDLP